jgi:hypothetical protein
MDKQKNKGPIFKENIDDENFDLDDEHCNLNNQGNKKNQIKYKQKIFLFDLCNNLYSLLNSYIKIDDRLRCIGYSEILYGPLSFNSIKYDHHIKCFINQFLDELDNIHKEMEIKKFQIIDNDNDEFNTLKSLNSKKIYSRISYCIEKWYVY